VQAGACIMGACVMGASGPVRACMGPPGQLHVHVKAPLTQHALCGMGGQHGNSYLPLVCVQHVVHAILHSPEF
jgi:hypothetical protein